MKARFIVNKAKRLEDKLHKLQWELYSFQSDLEDMKLMQQAELAGEAGFELDVSQAKMKQLWTGMEAAFCRKISQP